MGIDEGGNGAQSAENLNATAKSGFWNTASVLTDENPLNNRREITSRSRGAHFVLVIISRT